MWWHLPCNPASQKGEEEGSEGQGVYGQPRLHEVQSQEGGDWGLAQGSNVGVGLSKDQSMWSYRREQRTLRAASSPGSIPGLSPLQAWAAVLASWRQGKGRGDYCIFIFRGYF